MSAGPAKVTPAAVPMTGRGFLMAEYLREYRAQRDAGRQQGIDLYAKTLLTLTTGALAPPKPKKARAA